MPPSRVLNTHVAGSLSGRMAISIVVKVTTGNASNRAAASAGVNCSQHSDGAGRTARSYPPRTLPSPITLSLASTPTRRAHSRMADSEFAMSGGGVRSSPDLKLIKEFVPAATTLITRSITGPKPPTTFSLAAFLIWV